MRDVVAILGPTASGKSALAMAVAAEVGAEIINADALQVYRGFDIGTAKPTREEQERVPHHLIDVLDPDQRYSAGEFASRARRAIDEIRGRGRTALVVGGSGLYLRALFDGISPIPRGGTEVRRELRERLAADGLPALYRRLEEVDPETARRLPPGDTQRILRALEVERESGIPLSSWIARQPFGTNRLAALKVGLTLPRTILYDRIASRATQMFERGWVDEVRGLLEAGWAPELPAFQAIGYRQIAEHLLKGRTREWAEADTVRSTRRFAKRQLTWFRREVDVHWIPVPAERTPVQAILNQMRRRAGAGNDHA